MRALFVTVASHELYMPVAAWRNNMGPCAHITFCAAGPPNDEGILACARGYKPDVIFYIGSNTGAGIPSTSTFKSLRDLAPCILYQSDVEDEAWFDLLKLYRREGCFDLLASQTGVETDLIDLATLIAVDIDVYNGAQPKDLFCGFSGSVCDLTKYQSGVDDWDGRAELLQGLQKQISIRPREPVGSYQNYVEFMKRCMVSLNVSLTGSGRRHHVKWRVLESAFADCALVEMKDSPTSNWFPRDLYYTYNTVGDAKRVIMNLRLSEINRSAAAFSSYAREHYTPRKIFSGILDALPR